MVHLTQTRMENGNVKQSTSLAMQQPVVIDQIICELMVRLCILNLPMHLKKGFNTIGVSLRLH